ncbi:FY-rich, C-terminal [Dillenia turbinata]|uniref:FY-rich, C-terminal n=1 Tax=Dillenia turbinata TaxID=194707 RepID=A0AAN8VQ46_9MAGN
MTGFRTRVKFYSVLDPSKVCDSISEIVHVPFLGPLFKVTLGDSPSETFINFSAEKCWDMVLQRLNEEINKQGLHHLQPPQSINGLEMFGFFSPHIVQNSVPDTVFSALSFFTCNSIFPDMHRVLSSGLASLSTCVSVSK